MIKHWTKMEYLFSGNPTQVEVFHLLEKHRLLSILDTYHPLLVGTIPIGIHINSSDLDIICEVYDFEQFERLVHLNFCEFPEFAVKRKSIQGIDIIKANFMCDGWPVEIFGQSIATTDQNGYKHMIIEHRMMCMYGEKFKEQVIQLKNHGVKTEPAFATLLNLEGDPYASMLELYHWTDTELATLWAAKG